MEKEFKCKIGDTLDDVVNILLDARANGEHIYFDFNGHRLYSDNVTMNSAYIEITGYTKDEFEGGIEEEQITKGRHAEKIKIR